MYRLVTKVSSSILRTTNNGNTHFYNKRYLSSTGYHKMKESVIAPRHTPSKSKAYPSSSLFFAHGSQNNPSNLNTALLAGAIVAGAGIFTNAISAEESSSNNNNKKNKEDKTLQHGNKFYNSNVNDNQINTYRQKLLKKGKLMTKKMHVFDPLDRKENFDNVAVFSGNSNVSLAEDIVHYLNTELADAKVSKFADGETSVQLGVSCRGKNVFIIQSICESKDTDSSLNDSLMELLLMISAARRASAYRITAILPYFAYARQNRKVPGSRVTIAIADIAQLLASAGVDRVLTIDLHSALSIGSFPNTVNVTNLLSQNIGAIYFAEKDLHNPVVVSPKDGGINRAKTFAKALSINGYKNANFAAFIKEVRPDGRSKRVLLGDVKDCDCILVDDIIDTGTTLIKRAKNLKRAGARKVYAFATHGIFSGNSEKLVRKSPYLDEVVVSDTIPFLSGEEPNNENNGVVNEKVVRLSLAPLLAETIRRIIHMRSTSALTAGTGE